MRALLWRTLRGFGHPWIFWGATLLGVGGVGLGGVLLLATPLPLVSTTAASNSSSFAAVQRGRELAVIGDCTACHTRPGGPAFAGGAPIDTGFGNVVPSNITPDAVSGIGGWSDVEFIRAIRFGRSPDDSRYYPAMPYNHYVNVEDADVLAIFSYLKTVEPVRNLVGSNQLWFPFNIRLSVFFWNVLFFDTDGLRPPKTAQSPEWMRGRLLVEGLGHCASCHTPKNLLGGDKGGDYLGGAVIEGFLAPALHGGERSGLGGWSVPEVVEYLRSGRNRWAVASGPMAEAVHNSTSKMSLDDLRNIAVYLKQLAAPAAPDIRQHPSAGLMAEGRAVYEAQCSACHTVDGQGADGIYPSLKGNAVVQSHNPTGLLNAVVHGQIGVATDPAPTGPGMPAFGWKLTDEQIVDVTTYVRNAWGNQAEIVTFPQVQASRMDQKRAEP